MNERLLELAHRHGALKVRIAAQRRTLATHADALAQVLGTGDRAIAGIDWLKQHPAALGVAVAALVVTRPRRALRWAQRGFFAWRGWQSLRKKLFEAR